MKPLLDLRTGLVVWLVTVALIVWVQRRRKETGVGLVLAYLAILWLNYWLGAFIYVLPWYVPQQIPYWLPNRVVVEAGFEQVVYATIAFAIGVLLVGPMLRRIFFDKPRYLSAQAASLGNNTGNALVPSKFPILERSRTGSGLSMEDAHTTHLPRAYFLAGLFSYLVLDPLFRGLPTVTALISAASMLMIVGICLGAWQAWQTRNRRAFAAWLLAGIGQPFLTLMVKGFLVHGLAGAVMVLAFVVKFIPDRKRVVILVMTLGYIGMSIYVSYMRDRPAIRAVLWHNASIFEKAERIYRTVSTLEWFDIRNSRHLMYIDGRLNMDTLVGTTVYNLRLGYQSYAHGTTILWAIIALIPRAIWPDKPLLAGTSTTSTLSNFSNMRFGAGTSVAMGFVTEFYANFGTIGVVAGFLLLGGLLFVEDYFAAHYLYLKDWARFTLWLLPGIFVLQDGMLFETSMSAGAAVVVAMLANRFIYRCYTRQVGALNGVRGSSVFR